LKPKQVRYIFIAVTKFFSRDFLSFDFYHVISIMWLFPHEFLSCDFFTWFFIVGFFITWFLLCAFFHMIFHNDTISWYYFLEYSRLGQKNSFVSQKPPNFYLASKLRCPLLACLFFEGAWYIALFVFLTRWIRITWFNSRLARLESLRRLTVWNLKNFVSQSVNVELCKVLNFVNPDLSPINHVHIFTIYLWLIFMNHKLWLITSLYNL